MMHVVKYSVLNYCQIKLPKFVEGIMERFWKKVDKRGPEECWTWLASVQTVGHPYGYFRFGKTMKKAHRISWMLNNGEIPEGMCVLHKCDNPRCVNPAHLFIGTQLENIRDRDRKGRTTRHNSEKIHCIRGHRFSEKNTRIDKNGWRYCRTCDVFRQKKYTATRKGLNRLNKKSTRL